MSPDLTTKDADTTAAATHAAPRPARADLLRQGLRYSMIGVLVLLVALATVLYPGFLTLGNLQNILVQNAALGIVAVGMTLIIITGGFDLSVGAIYALGGTVFAGLTLSTGSPLVAGVATLVIGLACGSANGLLVAKVGMSPFVATLGSASVFSGLAYIYSNSAPFIVDVPTFRILSRGALAGIPFPIVVLLLTFVVGGVVLAKTSYGRGLYAVGGNQEASWLSGLRVTALTSSAYVATGVLSALAGMINASRLGVGQADVGGNLALDAIAVVVVGGTSLRGGEGAMWRSVIGLGILATLTNVFYSLNVSQHWQLIAKGLIVLGAVTMDIVTRRRNA